MEEKENPQRQSNGPEWLRITGIVLAYALTIIGIVFVIPLLFGLSRSWIVGFALMVFVIPLFPATQAILLKKKPANLFIFLKVYSAEFASLFLQLSLLLVSAPFIAVMVAGPLIIMLLITAILSWPIVGLQQLGFEIGRQLPKSDIPFLFWVTMGLALATALYYVFYRLIKKYEGSYFDLWAKPFIKIREFLRY